MTPSATCAIGEVSRIGSLYRAEQYDSDLGLYYLRARYYNPLTGRFLSRDPEDGNAWDPKTLHKYLYAGGDPIDGLDPMGREEETSYVQAIKKVLVSAPVVATVVVSGVYCLAVATLAEFNDEFFSSKEESHEVFAACFGATLFGILQGVATLF